MKTLLRKLRLTDTYGDISVLGMLLSGFVGVVGFIGCATAVMLPIENHSAHVSCLRLSEQTGLPTRFARSGMDGECYIQVDGKWIPEDRWRAVDDS